MSYATQDEILRWLDEDVLLQLTDDTDSGVIDDALVNDALAEASALIDGYVGSRYTLPLDNTPEILTRFCADLAICSLYDRRMGRPEQWKDRCKNAHQFLEKVAQGKIKLGADDPAGTGPGDTWQIDAADQIFSRERMKGY